MALRRIVGTRPPVTAGALWFALLLRACVSAFVVVAATVAAEAAGPFWGGLIVSLPIGAGPAYAMPGFGLALLTLHLAAVPLGTGPALAVALLPSLGWSVLLMAGRGRRLRLAWREPGCLTRL
jgi:hypothetical protein